MKKINNKKQNNEVEVGRSSRGQWSTIKFIPHSSERQRRELIDRKHSLLEMLRSDIMEPFKDLSLYESRDYLYLTGTSPQQLIHILKIQRPISTVDKVDKINMIMLAETFSKESLALFVKEMRLSLLFEHIYALFGFTKLSVSFYIMLVTDATVIASINDRALYCSKDNIAFVPITYKLRNTMEETRYRNILNSIDYDGNFYFSYSYPITNNLQSNWMSNIYWNNKASQSLGETLHSSEKTYVERDKMKRIQDRFMWNYHALLPLLETYRNNPSNSLILGFVVTFIHGYIEQLAFSLPDLETSGPNNHSVLYYTLIARRSRHFAGTRYLRRGVNDHGDVANEVETEQILSLHVNGSYRNSAFVQLRGSIPLCWSHNNIFAPAPNIILETIANDSSATIISNNNSEPSAIDSNSKLDDTSGGIEPGVDDRKLHRIFAKRHFENIMKRYGDQIFVLNLVRQAQNNREYDIGREYELACSEIRTNTECTQLQYKAFDLLNHSNVVHHQDINSTTAIDDREKEPDDNNAASAPVITGLSYLASLAYQFVQENGIFYLDDQGDRSSASETSSIADGHVTESSSSFQKIPDDFRLQHGVVRTNCIDCLDRTNVGQFLCAKFAAHEQLKLMRVKLSEDSLLMLEKCILDAWVNHGDQLAMQYSGTLAMHRIQEKVTSSTDINTSFGSGSERINSGAVTPSPNNTVNREVDSSSTSAPSSKLTQKEFLLVSNIATNALISMQRYVTNISKDFERQQAMDILLGGFVPKKDQKAIWDEDSSPQNNRIGKSVHIPLIDSFLSSDSDPEYDLWDTNVFTSFDDNKLRSTDDLGSVRADQSLQSVSLLNSSISVKSLP